MNHIKILLFATLFFFLLLLETCLSLDAVTTSYSLKDGDVLVSSGQKFELGFFSPGNSSSNATRRYVGIWYRNVLEKTVVWVANRDSPIYGTSGLLSINNQGNLILHETNKTLPVWSTNVSASSSIVSPRAQLLDTGNLVLLEQASGRLLWQSFSYPSDTMLPNMKLGLDKRTGSSWFLSSWKSQDDPGTGTITYKIDPTGFPQLFLYKNASPRWRAGPWTGLRWSGVAEMTRKYIFNVSFVNNKNEVSIVYGMVNAAIISRMTIDESGTVSRYNWNGEQKQWIGFWSAPKEECDSYNKCGPNGYCDPHDSSNFVCKCLPGFQPKSQEAWYLRDGSSGCVRTAGVNSTCHSGEGFVMLNYMKVPDTRVAHADMNMSLKACEQECLKNCSCNAYASADERGFGCLMWFGDLDDTRAFSAVGQDIYVRVDAAELAKQKRSNPLAKKGIEAIFLTVSTVTFLLLLVFLVWWMRRKRKAVTERSSTSASVNRPKYFRESPGRQDFDESGGSDLPLFELSVIAAATDNFSDANKLGEGGFGAVYKGVLDGGQEIAVKRLAKYSGQGIQEFKNEVSLIVKLQHRNLVRMLGCCVQEEEKMLIYEYLPNKSLDSFIFDEIKRKQLDWPLRFNIICGIVRGILYLHQDSRLKVIHRDLKASNVLLDASMNPKISDFGMARIFGVDQNEANTNRVVGTYGYMSPEYAMHGQFSVKSDVYSFGVLLLEIISGKKNSSYYEENTSSNLVGYVWDLWREGRSMEIVDPQLDDSYSEKEVIRCIHIGLLCAQEYAADRPTMSSIVFMLGNDTILPIPNQPAFILKKSYNSGDPSTSEGLNSVNDLTVTMMEPR